MPLIALENTGLEPHPDQPEDARVGDPVRQHPQQPLVVDQVEEAVDVGIEHPVHALAHDRRVQRRESLVRVPPRPEAVGEPEEVDFVDGAQRLGDRTLDDLVLQGRHAERTPPAIGFRDLDTPDRLGRVAPSVDPRAEILEVAHQVLLVVRHRHPINSRTGLPLLTSERSFERRDVDVVQQGGEPHPDGRAGRRVHPCEVGWQGHPALRPDPVALAWAPSGLAPSLGSSRCLRRRHRHYEPVRTPDLSSDGGSGNASPPSPAGNQSGGPVRASHAFRRMLFMRDPAFDPGGATPSRLAITHVLPSRLATLRPPRSSTFRGSIPHPA